VTLPQQSRFAGPVSAGRRMNVGELRTIDVFEVLEGLLCWAVEREGGGLSCRRGARIALTLGCGLGRPCGGLVEPWIRRTPCALHEHERSLMFMAVTTKRR
jgi:hypothetical protein